MFQLYNNSNQELPIYRYAVNRSVKNKTFTGSNLTTKYRDAEGTVLDLLEEVKKGFAINGATFGDRNRKKAHVTGVNLLLVDIDNNWTIDQALNDDFVKDYCAAIYTTSSHSKNHHKFRLVFAIPEVLNVEDYEALVKLIAPKFPSDKACSDAGRVFFGNSNCNIPLLNPDAVLPQELIEEAKLKAQKNEKNQSRSKIKQGERKTEYNGYNFNPQDDFELVRDALKFIPERIEGNGTYRQDLKVITAIVRHFEEEKALELLEEWSPNYAKLTKKVTQVDPDSVSIGTVFWRAEQNGWIHPNKRTDFHSITEERLQESKEAPKKFIEELKQNTAKLARKFKKGFGTSEEKSKPVKAQKTIKYDSKKGLPKLSEVESPKIIFKEGDRLKLISELEKQGVKFILDSSMMGTGKTHETTLIEHSKGKVWYLSEDHRNPSVAHVANEFADLNPRHNGMVKDFTDTSVKDEREHLDLFFDDPLNEELPRVKIRRADPEEKPDIQSNCIHTESFEKLYRLGFKYSDLNDADANNIVCMKCPFNGLCSVQEGNGYGFKHQRQQTLQQSKIRASKLSLPSPIDYDYSKDVGVVEEATQEIIGTESKLISSEDLAKVLIELEDNHPNLHSLLKPLLKSFYDLISDQTLPYYGLSHTETLEALKIDFSDSQIQEITKLLEKVNPNFADKLVNPRKEDLIETLEETENKEAIELNPFDFSSDRGVSLPKYLDSQEKQEVREQARLKNLETIENLPPQFLYDLFTIITNQTRGSIRVTRKGVSLTTVNQRFGEILQQFKQVILLDSTANKNTLALRIGIEPNQIIEIAQEVPKTNNLIIRNIDTEGLKSSSYSELAKKRAKALVATVKAKCSDVRVIGHKKHLEDLGLDGYWFRDNRGTNKFKNRETLIAIGTPRVTLNSAQDAYFALNETLEGFSEHYQELIEAEIVQLIGRQRAHLTPNKQFEIYLVASDFDASFLKSWGARVTNHHAFELTPDAGTDKQQKKWTLLNAIATLKESGQKFTQANLSQLSGISQSYISKLAKSFNGGCCKGWKDFKKIFLALIDSLRCRNNFDPRQNSILADWFGLNPIEEIDKFVQVIVNQDWQHFKQYLNAYSAEDRAILLGYFLRLVLPDETLRELEQIIDSPSDLKLQEV